MSMRTGMLSKRSAICANSSQQCFSSTACKPGRLPVSQERSPATGTIAEWGGRRNIPLLFVRHQVDHAEGRYGDLDGACKRGRKGLQGSICQRSPCLDRCRRPCAIDIDLARKTAVVRAARQKIPIIFTAGGEMFEVNGHDMIQGS